MKVLLVGDAVASTGFAACTHAAADALHAAGHTVIVLGVNYWGSPHRYPYTIYPPVDPTDGGRDQGGVARLPVLAERHKPDLIVLLTDPWNVPPYQDSLELAGIDIPTVGWLAVDGKNQHGTDLNKLCHVVVWTEFGRDELVRGGYTGPISVVPLGVDHSTFYPRDRRQSRSHLFSLIAPEHRPSPNAFVVGMVGRNQPRKRLDLAIDYVGQWIRDNCLDDVYLYMHVAPTGEAATDLASLAIYHGLKHRLIVARPHIGHGDPIEALPYLYSSFDVLLSTAHGEGWGLPVLEAMACAIPCVVPAWAAFDTTLGWANPSAIITVPCHTTCMTAPMGTPGMHVIGGVPDKRLTIHALNYLYRSPQAREIHGEACRLDAQRFSWDAVGKSITAVLEALHEGALPVDTAVTAVTEIAV